MRTSNFIAVISLVLVFALPCFAYDKMHQPWWQPQYNKLINLIDLSPKKRLSTSYKIIRNPSEVVSLSLSRNSDNSIVLKAILPKGAFYTIDKQTGKNVPESSINPIIYFRDHNADGRLDDFKLENPGFHADRTLDLTPDGYIINNAKAGNTMDKFWNLYIAYLVNFYINGVKSVFPK